jgi:hypothetical protein
MGRRKAAAEARHAPSSSSARTTTRTATASPPSGPARGGSAAFAFSAVNRFCMAVLHGRAGRLTA